MKRTLTMKLLVCYLLFGAVSFIIVCTFSQMLTKKNIIDNEASALYRESSLIASEYASDYFNSDFSAYDFQDHMELISDYLEADIWVINPDGEILLKASDASVFRSNNNKELNTPPKKEIIQDFDVTDFGSSYYTIGNFYDNFDEDTISVFSPITVSYQTRGYIVIHKPVSKLTDNINNIMNVSFYTVGLVFLIAFTIFIFVSFSINRPLKKITNTAKEYAKGNFTDKIEIYSNDEIGYLAKTLNYMATELGTLEEDQRKFVSNVSHDFRSPLTSIKGYVEAMKDGTIPVEMQDKYLGIILFETERLNKLTQSLIDLNKFGHHGIRLDIADFDINNMIRMTILTFEGKCIEKNIVFDLVLTGKELFVTADMTKVQQILYNLIDNAVKFSKNDSSIKIETNIKNEKVLISVKDSGIGIPKHSHSKIWDRFYKTDISRGKDKRGTGLGLSIVKEIINAHNENINVISTEGVGTEFIFTLPKSKKER